MAHPARPVRCGLADMGSHAIRFQIVEVGTDGQCRVLDQRREPVRLGVELFRTRVLPEAAIEDAATGFARFRDACREHGVTDIHAIATAAAREAPNRDHLLARIAQSSGIRVEVITGEQEAELLHAAVAGRVDLSRGRTLVADVGGGSVELLLVDAGALAGAGSFPFGALWLLEAVGPAGADGHDPELYRQHLHRLEHHAIGLLDGRPVDRYVVTGGGSASLADLLRAGGETRHIDGVESCPIEAIRGQVEALARKPLVERQQIPLLPRDRADTVVAGGVIYLRLGEVAGVRDALVPGVGLRDGLLVQALRGGGRG